MAKQKLFHIIIVIIAIFFLLAVWIGIIIFHSSFQNLKDEFTEEYEEITNVKVDFLPLGLGEKRLISKGNRIIASVEKYLSENGDYPSSLEVLVPNYISELPKTGYKRTYLFSLKVEDAVFSYSFISPKDRPEFAEFSISVRYGMFDEWFYSSRTKLWEWENH